MFPNTAQAHRLRVLAPKPTKIYQNTSLGRINIQVENLTQMHKILSISHILSVKLDYECTN